MPWHPDIPEEYRNQIVTGDARLLAKRLPDESVDLIFTDPVYWQIEDYLWLAGLAQRVLRPAGHLLVWQGVKWLPETLSILERRLTYRWTFGLSHLNACVGTIKGDVYSHWTPLFWFSKQDGRPSRRVRDFKDVPLLAGAQANHGWHKSDGALAYWLDAFAAPGAVVLDPFTGGGTVPAVCRMSGRNYVAFEIDPETATLARERVRLTPEPLLIVDAPEPQMALGME